MTIRVLAQMLCEKEVVKRVRKVEERERTKNWISKDEKDSSDGKRKCFKRKSFKNSKTERFLNNFLLR